MLRAGGDQSRRPPAASSSQQQRNNPRYRIPRIRRASQADERSGERGGERGSDRSRPPPPPPPPFPPSHTSSAARASNFLSSLNTPQPARPNAQDPGPSRRDRGSGPPASRPNTGQRDGRNANPRTQAVEALEREYRPIVKATGGAEACPWKTLFGVCNPSKPCRRCARPSSEWVPIPPHLLAAITDDARFASIRHEFASSVRLS